MFHKDYADIVGGILLILAGGFIALYALVTLDLGTVRRLGPGMFPMAIGVLIAVFGVLTAIPALFRDGAPVEIRPRAVATILGAIGVFGVLIAPTGLVPALIGMIGTASLAEQTFRPRAVLAMCVVLPLMAVLIFHIGIGLPVAMIRVPF